MRPTVSKNLFCAGFVLVVTLSACSGGGGIGDAVDAQQRTSPSPTSDDAAAADADDAAQMVSPEPTAGDGEAADAEGGGEGGSATIGGDETGLSLEIPGEWVDVPLDAETMSDGLERLDLPEEQAERIESSIGALGDLDGAVMAIDTSSLGASVQTNVNAYCIPNDGSVDEGNLETAIELGLGSIAGDIEVEQTSVDGTSAVRATYSIDAPQVQGYGTQYMFVNGSDICWVTFTAADESRSDVFEEIAASIRVL